VVADVDHITSIAKKVQVGDRSPIEVAKETTLVDLCGASVLALPYSWIHDVGLEFVATREFPCDQDGLSLAYYYSSNGESCSV